MLDVGAIASFVIWIANYPDWEKLRCASRRRRFLVKLGTDLVEDEINRRLQRPRALRKHSKAALRTLDYTSIPKKRHTEGSLLKKRDAICALETKTERPEQLHKLRKSSLPGTPNHRVWRVSINAAYTTKLSKLTRLFVKSKFCMNTLNSRPACNADSLSTFGVQWTPVISLCFFLFYT